MKHILLTALCLALTGCVNGFKQNYRNEMTMAATEKAAPYSGDTRIIRTGNVIEDGRRLIDMGHVLIGSAAFYAKIAPSEDQVMEQAKAVGADVVLWRSGPAGHVTEQIDVARYEPGTSSTTTTTGSARGSVITPAGGVYRGSSSGSTTSTTTTPGRVVMEKQGMNVAISEHEALFFRRTKK